MLRRRFGNVGLTTGRGYTVGLPWRGGRGRSSAPPAAARIASHPLCTEPRVPHVPHPQIIGVHPQLLVLGGRFRFRDVFLDGGGGRRQCTDVGTPEMQVPLAEDFSLSAARCRVAMSSPVPDFCGRAGPEAGGSAVPMLVVLERQR